MTFEQTEYKLAKFIKWAEEKTIKYYIIDNE